MNEFCFLKFSKVGCMLNTKVKSINNNLKTPGHNPKTKQKFVTMQKFYLNKAM